MIAAQLFKSQSLVGPTTALVTSTTVSARVDTLGSHGVCIRLIHPAAAATNSGVKWAAISIGVADTTTYSTANRILSGNTATAVTSSTEFVISAHNDTANASVTEIFINRPAGRYVFLDFTPVASTVYQNIYCEARLFNLDQEPSSASEAGAATRVFVA